MISRGGGVGVGTGVAVGGMGVAVGGTGVFVGGTGVGVSGTSVAVGTVGAQAASNTTARDVETTLLKVKVRIFLPPSVGRV